MSDPIQTIWSGGAGALIGSFLTWAGFRDRLSSQEARLVQLEKDVLYRDTCEMCQQDKAHSADALMGRVARLEATLDIGIADIKNMIRNLHGK
jgi:hypothetical protein